MGVSKPQEYCQELQLALHGNTMRTVWESRAACPSFASGGHNRDVTNHRRATLVVSAEEFTVNLRPEFDREVPQRLIAQADRHTRESGRVERQVKAFRQ